MSKFRGLQRVLSLVLCLIMVAGMLPAQVEADEIRVGTIKFTIPQAGTAANNVLGSTVNIDFSKGPATKTAIATVSDVVVKHNNQPISSVEAGKTYDCEATLTVGDKDSFNSGNLKISMDNDIDDKFSAQRQSDVNGKKLKIKWSFTMPAAPIAYAIDVENGSATVNGTAVIMAAAGTTVTLVADDAPDGKVFKEWASDDVEISDNTFTMPSKAVKITAIYEDVTYGIAVNGGVAKIANEEVNKAAAGATVTLVTNDAPAGKVFKEWASDDVEITAVYKNDAEYNVPVTLTGYEIGKNSWDAIITENSELNIDNFRFYQDDSWNPGNPGMRFNGPFVKDTQYWLRATLSKQNVDLNKDDVTASLNIGCQEIRIEEGSGNDWRKVYVYFKLNPLQETYTVTFDANGGTGTMTPVKMEADKYILPANGFTAPEGKQFKNWKIGSTEYNVGIEIDIEADTTVKAQWEEIVPITYTVTYNANGGTGAPAVQTKTQGVALPLTTDKPVCYGYTFKNWNTQKDGKGTSYASGAAYTADTAVTLYALKAYVVSFQANGGSGTMKPFYVEEGEKYILPSNKFTPPSGKVFDCWLIGDKTYEPGDKIKVKNDVTVTAQWKKLTVYSGSSSGLDYVPKTGDASGIMQWMSLLLFSAMALAGYEIFRRRSVK